MTENAASGEQGVTIPEDEGWRAWYARKRRRVWLTGACFLILFGLAALGGWWQNHRATQSQAEEIHRLTQVIEDVFSSSSTAGFKLAASSKTADSFRSKDPVYKDLQARHGYPPRVISTHDGYAQVYVNWAQTRLNLPLGWHAAILKGTATFAPPDDDRVRLSLELVDAGSGIKDSDGLQAHVRDAYERSAKFVPRAQVVSGTLSGQRFFVAVRGLQDARGTDEVTLLILHGHPQIPRLAMSLKATVPAAELDQYVRLMALIVRDWQVDWGEGQPNQEAIHDPAIRPYQAVADQAAERLLREDEAGYLALVSPNFKRESEPAATHAEWLRLIRPFFRTARSIGPATSVTPGRDGFGSAGYAFHRSVVASRGQRRPFTLYIVMEDAHIVVAAIDTKH